MVAGPVGQDGFDWYQLQGADVSGWAAGSFLTITAGSPSTAARAAAPAIASAASSALGGILSQVSRESNYDVNGAGIFVQPEAKAAADHLKDSPTALALLRKAAPAYLRITIAHFDAGSEGGEFSTLGHSIKLADAIMLENVDVQSTVLSHELQHASDILVDHLAPESSQACVDLELRAFRTQEKVWLDLTKPAPATTRLERELDDLSHTVDKPEFAASLAQLYAPECNAYGRPSPKPNS